jgi:hypothetical protein
MVEMLGLGTKGLEVVVPRRVAIRLGVFILERTARLGIREPEVMARLRRAVERREEHRGVLTDGLQEDLETRREGLGHLAISRVESVGRTDFWTWWKPLHRFNGSRLTTSSRDGMGIERLDSRSAGISQRSLRRAEHS